MNDIYQLNWKGPLLFSSKELESLPDSRGIYLLSNSSSPFLIDVHMSCMNTGDPSLSKPRILYIGMTSRSIKLRLEHHNIAQNILGKGNVENIYLYWLETDEPDDTERRLVSHIKPVFNVAFKGSSSNDGLGNGNKLADGITELEGLIKRKETAELAYQDLFLRYPFLLGGIFTAVESHQKFDDKNIPDFTAVRSKDNALDIIEIKQPFLKLTSDSGGVRSEFENCWSQAERYLDFARMEADYLRRQKNMKFSSPYCYLIAGYEVSENLKNEISRKQRMNPGIIFLTYDQVINTAKAYQKFILEISSIQ